MASDAELEMTLFQLFILVAVIEFIKMHDVPSCAILYPLGGQ